MKDGKQVVLAIGNNKQFASLCRLLGMSDLATDTRFAENTSRVSNRALLCKLLEAEALKLDAAGFLDAADKLGVPAGMIASLDELFTKQEAQAMIREEVREGQKLRCVSTIAFRGEP